MLQINIFFKIYFLTSKEHQMIIVWDCRQACAGTNSLSDRFHYSTMLFDILYRFLLRKVAGTGYIATGRIFLPWDNQLVFPPCDLGICGLMAPEM